MTFNTALSGIRAASDALGVSGNNIANASTVGFKQSRAEFADIYATSALGVGSNSPGTGVNLVAIAQQFTQGSISPTNRNLDLAVHGNGLFVLNDGGSQIFTSSGQFGVDEHGNIVNDATGAHLRGFLPDATGAISGTMGDLMINTANLSPQATTALSVAANLNSTDTRLATPFSSNFTTITPPASTSYNYSQPVPIYDSLGNQHTLTTYFVKTVTPNVWRVYVGIDGNNVMPQPAALPATPAGIGTNYQPTAYAQPFLAVFSPLGAYVPKSNQNPATYYGDSSAAGTLVTSAGVFDTVANVNANNTVRPTAPADLTINGTAIPATQAASDLYSSAGNAASAIALAAAINTSAIQAAHGATAVANTNSFTLQPTGYGNLVAGNFSINGVSIVGPVGAPIDSQATLLAAINAQTAQTGVVATANGLNVVLTNQAGPAAGKNIELSTTGGVASGMNFANFALTGGALDQVQVGTVSLHMNGSNEDPLVIGGSAPGRVGLAVGPQRGIVQTNSDTIVINGWDPGTGAALQNIAIDLSQCTQTAADYAVTAITNNGYAPGLLSQLSVSDTGMISAQYNNGQTKALGQVALATFNNFQGLQPTGNTSWMQTFASGNPLIGKPGTSNLGNIQSGALEDSNVDLASELVNLIVQQRNFQANAQAIRVEDAVTNAIINLK